MLKCDILITAAKTDAEFWVVRPITAAGMAVCIEMVGKVDGTLGVAHFHLLPAPMSKLVQMARTKKRGNLTVNIMHMADKEAEINARYLALRSEEKLVEAAAAEYFGPLIDAAIEARDKARLTELFWNYPDTVARSFVTMRLREAFPELKLPGVTLDNWHTVDQDGRPIGD